MSLHCSKCSSTEQQYLRFICFPDFVDRCPSQATLVWISLCFSPELSLSITPLNISCLSSNSLTRSPTLHHNLDFSDVHFEVDVCLDEDVLAFLEGIGGNSFGRYENSGDTDAVAREFFREVELMLAYVLQGHSADSEALLGPLLLLLQSFLLSCNLVSEVFGGLSTDSKA